MTYIPKCAICKAVLADDEDRDVCNSCLQEERICEEHNVVMKYRGRGIWDHRTKLNEAGEHDNNGLWHHCQGRGWFYSTW